MVSNTLRTLSFVTSNSMLCQVQVAQGTLEGKVCNDYKGKKYYSFEGIPYAKPPVGSLRFKDPQEPDSWSGVRDATKPGNRCAQLNPLGKGVFEGSEDCLYLNVYTPVLPEEKIKQLPVIFFVHGGRLVIGYGDYYKPDYYIQNDFILVTINYRLNVFGFLCLDTPEVPGNAGLKDTVMALKWVHNNIANFNGDVNNVTVFGESAGAAIGASYLTSKMADGLFSKVICQSGCSISELYIVKEDPIDRASKIASYLGKDIRDKNKLLELFRSTSVEDLVYAYTSAEVNRPPSVIHAFLLPVIEKKFNKVENFFEEPPLISLRQNRFKKVPMLVSIHSDEGASFLRKDENGDIYYEKNFEYFIPNYLFIKHNTPKASMFANKLKKYYFSDQNVEGNKLNYLSLLSDHYFNRDTMLFVELLAKYHKDVYLCRFGYSGKINTRIMKNLGFVGATHGDLIQYLFYRESKVNSASSNDLVLVDTLVDTWCNFAKTGKPTSQKLNLDWQPYDIKKKLCLNIVDSIKVESFPNFERIEFWFDLIKERSKL